VNQPQRAPGGSITAAGRDVPPRVVLVDKPVGPTSFDIVRMARRGTGARVGHAGTLDPFATGLLVLLIGQATRLSTLFMALPKEYLATVQFGAVSSTADPTGEIRQTGARTDAGRVVRELGSLRGVIRQRVPLTSAVKVDGEPLYKRAHRGETAETPEREVIVYDLVLVDFDAFSQRADIHARTGIGTYVRTLAEDLGTATGAGAYAASLRRRRVGFFSVADALLPGELSPERYCEESPGVYSLDQALGFLPSLGVDGREERLVANGNAVGGFPAGRFRVYGTEKLLAVYESDGQIARPLVVFP
jgi:tRNA pseudouridine55 synthase